MLILLSIILLFFAASFTIGYILSAPGYSGEKTDHFNGKIFINPSGRQAKGFKDLFKWMRNRERKEWKKIENVKAGPEPNPDPDPDSIIISFVNHSTFLIQYQGLNILTDPIWSERTSPFQWAGPQRMRPPGIRFDDLPIIDLVILSHNHYDHLDVNTLKRLNEAYQPKVICPLGISAFIKKLGFEQPQDLDWWQKENFKGLEITCVPAQHFSGRGMFDRDKTLWAGFVLSDDSKKIYFAGDTGYDEKMFKEIGAKFNSMDVSLIPIGAYKPRWFMSPIHVGPDEALYIHKDVNSKKSISMHYGTFPLADDGQYDPINDLQKYRQEQNISENNFVILEEGQSMSF